MSPINVTLVKALYVCFECGDTYLTTMSDVVSLEALSRLGDCCTKNDDGSWTIESVCDVCEKRLLAEKDETRPMCSCGRGPEVSSDILACVDCVNGIPVPGPDWLDDEDFVAAMEAEQEYAPCCEVNNMAAMEGGGFICLSCGAVEKSRNIEREEKLRMRYDI